MICAYNEAKEYLDHVVLYDGEVRDQSDCPYCKSGIGIVDEAEIITYRCGKCGWWKAQYGKNVGMFGNYFIPSIHGIAQTYSPSDIDVPIKELREFLSKKPNYLSEVNPTTFEHLMADCFRLNYAPCEVVHLGGTGDGGIDLKLILGDETRYLIQIKRRADLSSTEGVKVVRELNGVLFREGCAKGMVVTTANRYSQAAHKETAIKTETDESYEMNLLAFHDVVSMLNIQSCVPYEPWKTHLLKGFQGETEQLRKYTTHNNTLNADLFSRCAPSPAGERGR
nr:restriction endonuclease [uncultured Desulfuromonas sp.]